MCAKPEEYALGIGEDFGENFGESEGCQASFGFAGFKHGGSLGKTSGESEAALFLGVG